MKYCPITYEEISSQEDYSAKGLKWLAPQLKQLQPLRFNALEQRQEALARAGKMSIQGVQLKLSAQLKIQDGRFEIVDKHGHYILKPQSEYYPELPENEAVTMTLAQIMGLTVHIHGLVYSSDGSMTYFIKRFDRTGHNKKIAVEDFSQLLELDRNTKYQSSMEKIIVAIDNYCSFPKIEHERLLRLVLFNYLVGNEDMHVKNFSLITHNDHITRLAPAYDLLNTSIVLSNIKEELALPLNGKKNHLSKKDLLVYLAKERLGLNETIIDSVINDIRQSIPLWKDFIGRSFLSPPMQKKYLDLLKERCSRLDIHY